MKKLLLVVLTGVLVGVAGCGAQPPKTPPPAKQTTTQPLKTQVHVSLREAIAKFTTAHPAAAVTGIKLESVNGAYQYALTGVDDATEYRMTLAAKTGKKLSDAKDPLKPADANGVKKAAAGIATTGLLSPTAVTKLAEEQIGDSTASKWVLTHDAGSLVWQVTVKPSKGATRMVTIDAYTSEILKTSK